MLSSPQVVIGQISSTNQANGQAASKAWYLVFQESACTVMCSNTVARRRVLTQWPDIEKKGKRSMNEKQIKKKVPRAERSWQARSNSTKEAGSRTDEWPFSMQHLSSFHKLKEEEIITVSAQAADDEAASWAAKCAEEKHHPHILCAWYIFFSPQKCTFSPQSIFYPLFLNEDGKIRGERFSVILTIKFWPKKIRKTVITLQILRCKQNCPSQSW